MSDEQERREWEQQREREIVRENRQAARRAADPATRDQIDRSTGRTWGDAVGRGMYGDSRLQSFRDLNEMHRQARQAARQAQARDQGRAGRN